LSIKEDTSLPQMDDIFENNHEDITNEA
jgi:hypothetical protein